LRWNFQLEKCLFPSELFKVCRAIGKKGAEQQVLIEKLIARIEMRQSKQATTNK
jgi:hypothetical protein